MLLQLSKYTMSELAPMDESKCEEYLFPLHHLNLYLELEKKFRVFFITMIHLEISGEVLGKKI